MKIKDKGTLPQSKMFFTMANEFTKKALYYLINSGTFYCTEKYKVERDNFNSYLFIYVRKGKMKIKYKDRQFQALKDSFVFLNCHEPHIYEAIETETVFDWFHFSGSSSKDYFDLLYEKNGCVYSLNNDYIPQYMNSILKMAETAKVDEHMVSIYIQKIFYELNQVSTFSDHSTEEKVVQAIKYMETHYNENIQLKDIANSVYLSPYYFTRTFKKHMNSTPVQYLIDYRVNTSKKLLHNTSLSIKELARACGFNSTSHFVTTFKKHVGMSPNQFRDIQF